MRVARGAAREIGALGLVRARIGAVRDAVAVQVLVAREFLAGFEILARQDFAPVVTALIGPGQSGFQPLVHADVEIGHEEDRRLQPVGEVEALRRHLEALVRILGEEEHVLGVAVRGVGARDDVGLLGARRHAGRGPPRCTSMIVTGISAKYARPMNSLISEMRAGGGGEGARAVPAGADHDADRGELVFGLDDGELVLAGFLSTRSFEQ